MWVVCYVREFRVYNCVGFCVYGCVWFGVFRRLIGFVGIDLNFEQVVVSPSVCFFACSLNLCAEFNLKSFYQLCNCGHTNAV